MPHINLPENLAGISSLFVYSPETAQPMRELADTLLVKDNTLSRFERESIAAFVSHLNRCHYCSDSHSAIAEELGGEEAQLVKQIKEDYLTAPISEKLRSLLTIAKKVQKEAKKVLPKDIEQAKKVGATDKEIHDTVLITAAFCMYNKYVDGLATLTESNQTAYKEEARLIAESGYIKRSNQHS